MFLRTLYQTNTLAVQMLISCRGLEVLQSFLEEGYRSEKQLIHAALQGMHHILHLQVFLVLVSGVFTS